MIAVPLTKGYEAFIDPQDMELVVQYKWHLLTSKDKNIYAATHEPRNHSKLILLHRLIMNAPKGIKVDHKDGDGLNCTRDNMRLATDSQNSMNQRINANNKTGYKGVFLRSDLKKYQVCITVDGRIKYLGLFTDLDLAAKSYRDAAIKYYGEFANYGETK